MFSKKNLISTLVTAIWAFLGGYLLWGILGDPFLMEHLGSGAGTMQETPDFLYLIIGCVILACAFSTIYSKWGRDSYSATNGAQFGIWLGILLGFGSGIIDYATANILDMTGTLVNGVIYIVFFIVMGVLAGLVYSKMASSSNE